MNTWRLVFVGLLLSMSFTGRAVGTVAEENVNYHPDKAYQQNFYLESNLEFTLLHELAHAVIDTNHIPVLGGQESAADQIAVMLMITNNHGIDTTLLDRFFAISGEWMMQWREEVAANATVFWDVHPLSIQRFYEIACLVYGADPDSLETIRKESLLPIQRAWSCGQEFIRNREALAWMARLYSHVEFDEKWDLTTQANQTANSGKVILEVLPPIMDSGKEIQQFLVNSERLKYLITRANEILKLEQDIRIIVDPGCSGPDSWWNSEQNTIFLCYQLLQQFSNHSRQLAELAGTLEAEPEITLILRVPQDLQRWMIKESVSPAHMNQKFIDWLRQQTQTLAE